MSPCCTFSCSRGFPDGKMEMRRKHGDWNLNTYSIVFVEKIAPLVLNVEQEGEHDHDVDERDEGHDNQTAVHLF